ncbi:hypothetical protein TIFTF001_045596 [Ficus carica]|uniref:Uncharacterized protein n=1 Tax=Ficus carica TaxID=3494 RepID=A0AA87YSP0_FICCA|nr:hypothetical protein TIFTF001_045596 [Ficus carica]
MWQGIPPCARLSESERACSRTRLTRVRASANVPSHIWFDPARRSYSARSSRPDLLCENARAHPQGCLANSHIPFKSCFFYFIVLACSAADYY